MDRKIVKRDTYSNVYSSRKDMPFFSAGESHILNPDTQTDIKPEP